MQYLTQNHNKVKHASKKSLMQRHRIVPELDKIADQTVIQVLSVKSTMVVDLIRTCQLPIDIKSFRRTVQLHNRNEKSNRAQTCAGMKSPHAKWQLFSNQNG